MPDVYPFVLKRSVFFEMNSAGHKPNPMRGIKIATERQTIAPIFACLMIRRSPLRKYSKNDKVK